MAALAAVSAASAQSSVTLYGYGDMGVGRSVGTNEKVQFNPGLADVGGIRWGMRGTEDLGGGLKANFQMETNAVGETGTELSTGFGRAAWFGLSSTSFGSVQLGRQARNSVVAAVGASPAGWRGSDPENAVGIRYSISNNVGAASSRISSMVNYISPNIYGVTARVGFVAAQDNGNKSVVDAALIYANGPLMLSTGYIKAQTEEANYGVHGSYNLGMATVMGSYNKVGAVTKAAVPASYSFDTTTGLAKPVAAVAASTVAAQDGFSLGVKAPFGATTVYTTYARNSDTKVQAAELGADYALSKRTALTAFGAKASGKSVGYYMGVRHAF